MSFFRKTVCRIDRCDSGASSADNPRTALDNVTARAAGLPTALTNTSMTAAPANPALVFCYGYRPFISFRDDNHPL